VYISCSQITTLSIQIQRFKSSLCVFQLQPIEPTLSKHWRMISIALLNWNSGWFSSGHFKHTLWTHSHRSRFTIHGDACPLSCVNAEACLRGWTSAWVRRGRGKLVNAALLSLINEVCVNVCCATLFSSELVGPACVQARSSNPRGTACRPSGKGSGRRGYWVTLYLFIYTARLLMSVFL